jgi:hypothetical protein
MLWDQEDWVKLYVRDTPDWLALSWKAQGLFCLLMRKVNRAGILDLGKRNREGVAAMFGPRAEWPEILTALDELVEDGCVVIAGSRLVMPNFVEAQAARTSDRVRKAQQRARERDLALAAAVAATPEATGPGHAESPPPTSVAPAVTARHTDAPAVTAEDETVTAGHAESQQVTLRGEERRREEKTHTSSGDDATAPDDDGHREEPAPPEEAPAPEAPSTPRVVELPLPGADPFGPEALARLWNELAPPECPRLRTLSESRRRRAATRIREHPREAFWREVLDRMADQPFLRGGGKRGWKADFDWLLQPDSATRVLEGSYADEGPAGPPSDFVAPAYHHTRL